MTNCKSCGFEIKNDQGIMTNLSGAYHKDDSVCAGDAKVEAPVWGRTA